MIQTRAKRDVQRASKELLDAAFTPEVFTTWDRYSEAVQHLEHLQDAIGDLVFRSITDTDYDDTLPPIRDTLAM